MKKYIFLIITILILTVFSCQTSSNRGLEVRGSTEYDPNVLLALSGFGLGINIGNTLDAIGTNEWHARETGWGNPPITQGLVQALKGHGFKTIRLPVTWAEYIGPAPNYQIGDCVFSNCNSCPNRMNRVEQVVNWILEEDLYCILNLHHDGGYSDKSWILDMAANEEETLRKFRAVWQQIALRFRNAPENLILESMNEVGFDSIWNRWSGDQSQKPEAYRKLNVLNQAFVSTVRSTGGNNAIRPLLIAGYWTDIDNSIDSLFVMPNDPANNLIFSAHYYTPPQFAIAEDPDTSWGFRNDWGSRITIDADMEELIRQFDKLKTHFLDKGIPVILGEYGATKKNKNEAGRIRWMAAVTQICLDYGICPVLWDTGINPSANNHSGEIERNAPYGMSDNLKRVLARLRVE